MTSIFEEMESFGKMDNNERQVYFLKVVSVYRTMRKERNNQIDQTNQLRNKAMDIEKEILDLNKLVQQAHDLIQEIINFNTDE